jgi:hypothetical protein
MSWPAAVGHRDWRWASGAAANLVRQTQPVNGVGVPIKNGSSPSQTMPSRSYHQRERSLSSSTPKCKERQPACRQASTAVRKRW